MSALSVSNGHGTLPDTTAATTARPDTLVEACLAALRALGPSVEVSLVAGKRGPEMLLGAARVRNARFAVHVTRSHVSHALATSLGTASANDSVLFAPYVPPGIGRALAAQGVGYVDAVGNCHVVVRGELFAHVEGRRATAEAKFRPTGRLPSHQLVFAILADPSLLEAPVRRIADEAGIGKSAAAALLVRLEEQRLLLRTRGVLRIGDHRALMDRWLSAYAELVRPRWWIGRYRAQDPAPEALERKLAELEETWALGGGAAAWRMTGFYRGVETVVHVADAPRDLPRRLRLLPAPDGPVTLLRTPGALAYRGPKPHVAHPLLVYTELLLSDDPRMREAAADVRKTLPKELR